MTKDCLKTTNVLVGLAHIMLKDSSTKVLITEPIMVHKDVEDVNVHGFIKIASKLDVDNKNWKDNTIVCMNEDCVCMKGADGKFYLFNAKVSMMSTVDDSNTMHVLCDYKQDIKMEDFIALGA